MVIRVFVENNYTKKNKTNHFAAKIYPTLCYGDLDAELDFPSCEITFCSPAGQPHHFATPHCRLPLLHTHAAFSTPWPLLLLQHLASRYMSLSVGGWEKTVSSARHFIGSALVQTRKNGNLSHSREARQSDPSWLAEIPRTCLRKWIGHLCSRSTNVKHHTSKGLFKSKSQGWEGLLLHIRWFSIKWKVNT